MTEGEPRPAPAEPIPLPSGTVIEVFNPKQASRLAAFRNILRRVHQDETTLRESGKPNIYGRASAPGIVTETWMTMDSKFLDTWNHVADSMYQTELAGEEKTKQAALEITRQVRKEFDGPEAMSAEEANELFNR